MLNVRISSLPSDRQTAAKGWFIMDIPWSTPCLTCLDCRRCIKRRIKCDRTTPRCQKCTIREFQCPGYDAIQLKWGLGVTRIQKPSEKSSASQSNDKPKDADRSTSSALVPRSRVSPRRDIEHHVPWIDQINSPRSVESTPSPTNDRSLVDSYTSTILSRNLFTHFNIKVAPRLTWVDRPDHPWRKVIAPLAQRSGCLGLSILSVAAAHLSFTSSDIPSTTATTQSINHRLRDASLHRLNQKINTELANAHSTTDHLSRDSTLIEILATTLVLCYGEMLIPHSTDWQPASARLPRSHRALHLAQQTQRAAQRRNRLYNPRSSRHRSLPQHRRLLHRTTLHSRHRPPQINTIRRLLPHVYRGLSRNNRRRKTQIYPFPNSPRRTSKRRESRPITLTSSTTTHRHGLLASQGRSSTHPRLGRYNPTNHIARRQHAEMDGLDRPGRLPR